MQYIPTKSDIKPESVSFFKLAHMWKKAELEFSRPRRAHIQHRLAGSLWHGLIVETLDPQIIKNSVSVYPQCSPHETWGIWILSIGSYPAG